MSRFAVEDILRKCKCGPREKLVLMSIASWGGGDGSGGHPTVRRIALMAGVSRSTVQTILKALRDKSWLSWTSGSAKENTANTYTIHLDAIPIIDWTLYRSQVQAQYLPPGHPVPATGTAPVPATGPTLYRFGSKPVPATGTHASTKANTKDDDRSSSSFSLRVAQEFWNAHRGPMGESTIRLTSQLERLFAARVKDGLTEELCQQAISKMAALPHFRGETNGNLGAFVWLLGMHKETGEPNFRKVLRGDYDPRPAKKKAAVVPQRPPSYKDYAHPDYERKPP